MEEQLLRRRVFLQLVSGFIDRSAMTVTLSVVVILGSWLWPNASFGIGIILAARYLYSGVQNNLVNYRVIRLAWPMMRDLENLEASEVPGGEAKPLAEGPLRNIEVLTDKSRRARLLRSSATLPGTVFVPCNPRLSQSVLSAWKTLATSKELYDFTAFASAMGLSSNVIGRFWYDATTLSSGEHHRAVVALVLAEKPKWLILDNTFAALDPATRDKVATIIFANVAACTIITNSEEYVPTVFTSELNTELSKREQQFPTSQTDQVHSVDMGPEYKLPDPSPEKSTFLRSIRLLFGPHVIWIILGAILIASSEVVFALSVAGRDTSSLQITFAAGFCALGATIGAILFFGPLYFVPIARLSELHGRIIRRIDQFASSRISGAVVGRIGDDFSDLQMSVPGALGSVFIVTVQSVMLIAGAVAGVPLFIVAVAIVMPLALLVMRQGKKYIVPAATEAANRRGEFLGAVGAQAGLHTAPLSERVRLAGEVAYEKCEAEYLEASTRQANAYAYRSILIQSLSLVLNIFAVVLITILGGANPFVAPAAVIFFAVTLSSGIESTVETLQEVGVIGVTTERVRLLEEFESARSYPPVRTGDLNRLEKALSSGIVLIGLIGATGAGKSVLLDALCRRIPDGEVVIIPDADPFALEQTDLSGLLLARSESQYGTARLLLLDETMRNLSPQQERAELKSLSEALECRGKQGVVVLHSRSNLDCFAAVINMDE
ncbi:ABC transporter ATP-binding protein [Gleimia hominis]|uniref:ABC transporter ATP-binding protein n=1 Tax=Gleimia hominis TaxID=595468 RepID=A0ABU3I9Y8_9ACTO|nr:ABC transporter ATP-binding protein [Gleimia hominis]MDT3767183.1 ABC transporter ATP-binding protein [Gleimia hominis]